MPHVTMTVQWITIYVCVSYYVTIGQGQQILNRQTFKVLLFNLIGRDYLCGKCLNAGTIIFLPTTLRFQNIITYNLAGPEAGPKVQPPAIICFVILTDVLRLSMFWLALHWSTLNVSHVMSRYCVTGSVGVFIMNSITLIDSVGVVHYLSR